MHKCCIISASYYYSRTGIKRKNIIIMNTRSSLSEASYIYIYIYMYSLIVFHFFLSLLNVHNCSPYPSFRMALFFLLALLFPLTHLFSLLLFSLFLSSPFLIFPCPPLFNAYFSPLFSNFLAVLFSLAFFSLAIKYQMLGRLRRHNLSTLCVFIQYLIYLLQPYTLYYDPDALVNLHPQPLHFLPRLQIPCISLFFFPHSLQLSLIQHYCSHLISSLSIIFEHLIFSNKAPSSPLLSILTWGSQQEELTSQSSIMVAQWLVFYICNRVREFELSEKYSWLYPFNKPHRYNAYRLRARYE